MLTESQRLKNLEIVKNLRLLDDTLMTKYFNGFTEGTAILLNVILERSDMEVIEVVESVSRREYKSMYGRSVKLDIYARDAAGKIYNIEVQRASSGASAKRARFHSSMLDTNLLAAGENFDNLAETYVIFITEDDVIGKGKAMYHIDRKIEETGEFFNDGTHIIFVNGAFSDESNPIGRLMHDFHCSSADQMYNSVLAKRLRYFKETEGGVSNMCKAVEDFANEVAKEAAKETAKETAKRMLMSDKLTVEEIARFCGLSVEEVEELAS